MRSSSAAKNLRRGSLLILGIWMGALLAAGAVTAPVLFKKLDSRSVAGEVFGNILLRLNGLELICILLLIALKILFYVLIREQEAWRRKTLIFSNGILALMIGIWVYYAQIVTPEMTSLRQSIRTFDVEVSELARDPAKQQELAARERFDILHRKYSKAMKTNIVLGVVMFFIP